METGDLCRLAADLAIEHGHGAVLVARQATVSLELAGEKERAQVWQSISVLLDDIFAQRLDPEAPIVIN